MGNTQKSSSKILTMFWTVETLSQIVSVSTRMKMWTLPRINVSSFNLLNISTKTFEQLWFQLTPEKAASETYDIIVIGTGMGAGVVASDLFDTNSKLGNRAKSVLVIVKGGLVFHSHCLNAARPSGFGVDHGQQKDTFFALFKGKLSVQGLDAE